jgi:hypothetical protein
VLFIPTTAYYTVVISKPELAYQTFVINGKHTSDRAPMQSHGGDHVPSMYIATKNGKGIAMSTGKYWRKVRTALEKNISRKDAAEANADLVMNEVGGLSEAMPVALYVPADFYDTGSECYFAIPRHVREQKLARQQPPPTA